MRQVILPNGVIADYDSLRAGNAAGQPGIFCPFTGTPLDEDALNATWTPSEFPGDETTYQEKLDQVTDFQERLAEAGVTDITPWPAPLVGP